MALWNRRGRGEPHPRREPRYPGPLTAEGVEEIFRGCVDFTRRPVALEGGPTLTLCYLSGMVKMERVSDYVLRPLAQDGSLAACAGPEELMARLEGGALYNLSAARRTTLDQAAADLVAGWCLLFFPGQGAALSLFTGTEEKRSISAPASETVLKGARDAFVESLRTNTSIVRRHLKTPELRIAEHTVGRQSATLVDVLYIEGIADPELARRVSAQLADMDIDAVLATGNIEEYIVPAQRTPFPLLQYTERSDRFCAGLAEGRVGVLIDGLPLGYLAPGVLGDFLRAPQDKSESWMLASALTLLRCACMLVTLLLPALYVAMVTFHQEMIPTRLALSIIGGLVVGSAAVEAKIVSPAVLIVVAVAGIAGYTMPSQELAGALRIWRFLLVVCASLAGLFGAAAALAALVVHLAGLESFGVSYLSPFSTCSDGPDRGGELLRRPLPRVKWRPAALHPRNRRNQR